MVIDGELAFVGGIEMTDSAGEQLSRRRAGAPATHRLLELPGVSRRSRRLLGPLEGLIDDG